MIRRLFFELRYLLGDAPWDTGVSPPELIDYMRNHPPGKALDLGCGTGTNSMTMAGFGWTVLGIDVSALAIFIAHRKARHSNADVHFIRGDVTRAGIGEGPFDLVLDIGCFHALPLNERSKYTQRLAQSTRPGSDYLLYTWVNTESSDPESAPTEESLRTRLTPLFEFQKFTYGTDRDHISAWIFATRSS
ncbi:MAG: class I SAM-dependent methyltransferase [Anaerolineales bacterium]|jgi:SAM-dependent methyltransferase